MSQIELGVPTHGDKSAGCEEAARDEKRVRPLVWTRSDALLSTGALAGFAVLCVLTWWVRGEVVPWDSKNQFYEMFRFLGHALSHGSIPLWNPYQFSGYPTVADPQSLLFTPTMFLFALLAPHASMQVFDAMVYAHLLGGGFGMLGLGRRRGWRPQAALLAALVFMFGGPAASRLQHTGMIISYGFIPLAIWSLEAALERRSWRSGILAAIVIVIMAIGRDQVAFLACLMMFAIVGWTCANAETPGRWLRERAWLIAAIFGLALAFLLIPSLLTMQFLASSNRPAIPYAIAIRGSLSPVNFATMLAPNIFGSLNWISPYWGPSSVVLTSLDWTDRTIDYLFIGTAPALLLLWHGVAGRRLLARGPRFFFYAGLCAALYAIGRWTPAFGLLFRLAPGVRLYRRPADATFILNVAMAFMCGYLLDQFMVEGSPHLFKRASWATTFGCLAAAAAAALAFGEACVFSNLSGHLYPALRAAIEGVLVAILFVLLLDGLERARLRGLAALSLVVLTGAQLWSRNVAASINAEKASDYSVYSGLSAADARGVRILRQSIEARISEGQRPRVEILGMPGAWQNAAMTLRIEDTLGYNPLRVAAYQQAVGPGGNAQDLSVRRYPSAFPSYGSPLASLLGLEYLVLHKPIETLPAAVRPPKARLLFSDPDMYVYELGPAAPRAYVAAALRPIDARQTIRRGRLPDLNVPNVALIGRRALPHLARSYPQSAEAPAGRATIVSYHDDRIEIAVDDSRPGVLVLHDIFYPGWQVRVDGRRRPILLVDLLFRGVETPAGHHIVVFSFHPFSLDNLSASLAGLIRTHFE